MSTLQYQPGAAYMCDDKRAVPILAQLADAAAAGAESLRRPLWRAWISLPKSCARSSAARSSPGPAIADHLVPASDRPRPSRSPRPLSLLRRKRSFAAPVDKERTYDRCRARFLQNPGISGEMVVMM